MAPVYLPEYLEPMAHRFSEDFCEYVEGVSKNNPKYERVYSKAMTMFCTDYNESLTGTQANPSSGQAVAAFRAFEETGFVPILKGRFDKNKAEVLIRRLKASVIHLLHIHLAADFATKDMKVKRQSSELLDSAYEYSKKSGNKEQTKQQMSESNKERYVRILLVASIMAAIERVFSIQYGELKRIVDASFSGHVPSSMSNGELNDQFAKTAYKALREEFRKAEIAEAIKKSLTSFLPKK